MSRHPFPLKPAGALRLLVVDDIALVRDMVAELFRHAGFEVETAADAAEALAAARMVRWDGLILDMDMPDMDGLNLYAEIVRINHGDRLPVVFFTGRPDNALQTSLSNVPWAYFVLKPCPGPQLVAIMWACLRAVSGRRDTAGNS